jgi:hypothetical protein
LAIVQTKNETKKKGSSSARDGKKRIEMPAENKYKLMKLSLISPASQQLNLNSSEFINMQTKQ